jgi:hypothetical protein
VTTPPTTSQKHWKPKMTDSLEHIDVVHQASAVVEIDAGRIAQIVFDTCHTTEARSAKAANLVLEYIAEVHQNAIRPQ